MIRNLLTPRRRVQGLIALSACVFLGQNSLCPIYTILENIANCDCSSGSCALPAATNPPNSRHLAFEANGGQAGPGYEFLARGSGMIVFLAGGEAFLDLRDARNESAAVLRMGFVGGARRVESAAEQPRSGRVNYIFGNDPSRWIKDVPVFGRVRYKNVYPGIDVVYYGSEGSLEHDFVVAPGADPEKIRLKIEGASSHRIDAAGDLVVQTAGREVVWKKPALYQDAHGLKRRIEGRYRDFGGAGVGFSVGVYDTRSPLVIDPVILYSTFVGRGGNDTGGKLAVDASGNVYMTGITNADQFPVTPGAVAPQTGSALKGDLIITKLNAAGSDLVYSTHIGGVNFDWSGAIAVDAMGSAYVAGTTSSDDFPVTSDAFQKRYASARLTATAQVKSGDCFVLKLNSLGNSLLYSSYLGGSSFDGCTAIAVDAEGSAYVAGFTGSANFPTSENAFQRAHFGGTDSHPIVRESDGFVTKINPSGTAIVYSSFIGGTRDDLATAIAVDSSGSAYVAGSSSSAFGFPVTAGAPQPKFAGTGGNGDLMLGDAFLLKVNPSGSALLYSTFLGGKRDDIAFGIAVDSKGTAYMTGSTLSQDFPVTAIARQANYRGEGGVEWLASGDAFVAKMNPSGTAFEYVTYLGGSKDDRGIGIAVDPEGNAWITGNTVSLDWPVSSDAVQRVYAGERPELFKMGDGFVAKLSANGQTLLYSSYLGGFGNDWGVGIALDRAGSVYVTGGTSSSDFPTTQGAYQRNYGTAQAKLLPLGDAFIVKLGEAPVQPTQPPAVLPSISRLSNAASYDGPAVSPGEIVLVSGVGLGPQTLVGAALAPDGRLSTILGETRVLFDGIPAPLVYASATGTSAIVPYQVLGRTQVAVEYKGVLSAPVAVPVAASAPGIFSANASGRGQAAALNQDGNYNSAANPAAKGEYIVLFGTGEGQTDPAGLDGRINNSIFPRPVLPPRLTIGGLAAEVAYAGAAPGQVSGLLQVNARIPVGVAGGDVAVLIGVGNSTSQQGLTIAVK